MGLCSRKERRRTECMMPSNLPSQGSCLGGVACMIPTNLPSHGSCLKEWLIVIIPHSSSWLNYSFIALQSHRYRIKEDGQPCTFWLGSSFLGLLCSTGWWFVFGMTLLSSGIWFCHFERRSFWLLFYNSAGQCYLNISQQCCFSSTIIIQMSCNHSFIGMQFKLVDDGAELPFSKSYLQLMGLSFYWS